MKRVALSCAVHNSILEECTKSLEEHGYFSKGWILKTLGMSEEVGASIRWDSIRSQIEEDSGCRLLPVSVPFTPGMDSHLEGTQIPKSWLATGRSSRTKGYVCFQYDACGVLAIKRLKGQAATVKGISRVHNTDIKRTH